MGTKVLVVGFDGAAPELMDRRVAENKMNDRDVLAQLLKLGVADARARHQALDLDTNEELPRLIPILCASFSREELSEMLGEQITEAMLAMHRTEALQNLFLEHTLRDVLHAFHEADIPLMLFKGPALAYQFYAPPHLRTYHDVDAFVQPGDLEKASELLAQRGFIFYEEFRSNITDATRTGYNYILKQTDSWLEMLIELHTAPHPSDIGAQFDASELWERARRIELLGEPVLTMDHIDHLLYLCWHYRFHGFTRLLWLYDLVVMLRALQVDMDWSMLVRRARRQNLATTLYYCLSWCRSLFAVEIPESVLKQLRPPLVSRVIVERFAMPDVMKALASQRWQARRIIARRAMVDSTSDLWKAALRALFPSKATIGRRYLNNSRLPLRLYGIFYVIHPIVTLAKGVAYIFGKRDK
ncbi:MAG: nucleotidyltransferase domain-containing protein [Ktedonobacteraceae bacterium]